MGGEGKRVRPPDSGCAPNPGYAIDIDYGYLQYLWAKFFFPAGRADDAMSPLVT